MPNIQSFSNSGGNSNRIKLKFLHESGAVIGGSREVITMVDGEWGSVDFPEELIWKIHKENPGMIVELAHTHPPDMYQASPRDLQTLKTWAYALYPYPIRLSVISGQPDGSNFKRTVYLAILEPKEIWLKHKDEERKFEVILERRHYVSGEFGDNIPYEWEQMLLQRSYVLDEE